MARGKCSARTRHSWIDIIDEPPNLFVSLTLRLSLSLSLGCSLSVSLVIFRLFTSRPKPNHVLGHPQQVSVGVATRTAPVQSNPAFEQKGPVPSLFLAATRT